MHDVERRTGDMGDTGRPLHRVGLDEWRPGRVPGGKPALPVRIGRLHALAQHPGELDRLRMRADHPAMRRRGLAQPQQEAVIDIRQAEPLTFAAAVVHEDLEAGHAEFGTHSAARRRAAASVEMQKW